MGGWADGRSSAWRAARTKLLSAGLACAQSAQTTAHRESAHRCMERSAGGHEQLAWRIHGPGDVPQGAEASSGVCGIRSICQFQDRYMQGAHSVQGDLQTGLLEGLVSLVFDVIVALPVFGGFWGAAEAAVYFEEAGTC